MSDINGKPLLKRAKVLDNDDHAFGKYLRGLGWAGLTIKKGNMNKFLLPHGKVIAIAAYDNAECFYRVWIRKYDKAKADIVLNEKKYQELGNMVMELLGVGAHPKDKKAPLRFCDTSEGTKSSIGVGKIVVGYINKLEA